MLPSIKYIFLFPLLFLSCTEAKRINYSVAEIVSKDAREIEVMDDFSVTGAVTGKLNIGLIKVYKLNDVKDNNQYIFIISNHATLPSIHKETTVRIKLYKEIAFNDIEFLIFKEISE